MPILLQESARIVRELNYSLTDNGANMWEDGAKSSCENSDAIDETTTE